MDQGFFWLSDAQFSRLEPLLPRDTRGNCAAPNIPPKLTRRCKSGFSPYLYRSHNAIERMFNRLDDFRRIATRYDRLAVNFLATVQIAPIVSY